MMVADVRKITPMIKYLLCAALFLLAGFPSAVYAQQSACPASSVTPNIQAGTSYTLSPADRCGWVVFTNAGSIAVTLPSPGINLSPGFTSNLLPTAGGTVTLTASVSGQGQARTINGSASPVALAAGQGAAITALQDSNWYALPGGAGGAGGGMLTSAGNATSAALQTLATKAGAAMTTGGGTLTGFGSIGSPNSIWTTSGASSPLAVSRLLVGAAAAVNPGNAPESPSDWVNTFWPSITQNNQLVSISPIGLGGIVGATRSGDFPQATGGSIGVSALAYANDTTANLNPAWAAYVEANRASGAHQAIGIEIDVGNNGTVTNITPRNFFLGTGLTAGLWDVCGGAGFNGAGGSNSCTVALGIGQNTKTWQKGIVFSYQGLDPANGNGGAGISQEMYIGQSLRWLDGSDVLKGEIWGTASGLTLFPAGGGVIVNATGATPSLAPQAALHVAGSFNTGNPTWPAKLLLSNNGTATSLNNTGGVEFRLSDFGAGYGWRIGGWDLGGGDNPFVWQVRQNSATWTERLRLGADGAITLGATAYANCTSLSTVAGVVTCVP